MTETQTEATTATETKTEKTRTTFFYAVVTTPGDKTQLVQAQNKAELGKKLADLAGEFTEIFPFKGKHLTLKEKRSYNFS